MSDMLADLPDNQLLKQCKKGSEAAFNVLFRRYFDDLLQFAVRQLDDQEQAEELVMDLMLKLWQLPAEKLDIQDLKPYLFRSVKNAIISNWRKKALSVIPLKDLPESAEPRAMSSDYHIVDTEIRALYQKKLAQLSPQRRLVFTLSRERDMTNLQIAEATSLSVTTVKKHLKASLDYFRASLKTHTEAGLILLFLFLS